MAVGVDNVEKSDDVGISHLFEKGDFSDSGGRDAFIFGLETDFLQGNDTVIVGEISSLVDDTIRSYTK